MAETTCDGGRHGIDEWETVARHDFGGRAELDATIVAALDGEHPEPLYATVDTESVEQFLASVDAGDARVRFRVAGRLLRVLADGRVQLRRSGDPDVER